LKMLADAARQLRSPRLSGQLNRTGYDASTAARSEAYLRQAERADRSTGKKMAAPCDTAKFREETSKKAVSTTKGRIAAVHNVGG
jgi:hypothetical protein